MVHIYIYAFNINSARKTGRQKGTAAATDDDNDLAYLLLKPIGGIMIYRNCIRISSNITEILTWTDDSIANTLGMSPYFTKLIYQGGRIKMVPLNQQVSDANERFCIYLIWQSVPRQCK